MDLIKWVLGPQLIGLLIFIIGLIQYSFPPKHINNWYGYRMPSAQKNQQTWDTANRYSAIYMIKAGVIVFIIGMLVAVIVNNTPMPAKIKQVLPIILLMATGMLVAVLAIVATEKHLEKTFDQKTE